MTNERFLIINADDYGMCHSTNHAISTLLLEKSITSASLMMTCPWTLEAAHFVRKQIDIDVGIHLTLTSEWRDYKWGPISPNLKTLVNDCRYFPAETSSVIARADASEIREEAISQIELALKMGISPTNIDNHMVSMHHEMEILLDLCDMYQLPLRYPKHEHAFLTDPSNHAEIVAIANKKGIVLLDHIDMLPFSTTEGLTPTYERTKDTAMNIIRKLKPGVTELVLHPSLDSNELRAITDTFQSRQYDFDVFRDADVKALLKSEDIRLIQWRDLQTLQRA
jgi:predicted glycoside hydrolase/deacetylase ChbG (UPF0249 family)